MARIIDEVTISIKAGDGGKGCESRAYISEKKFIPTGGEGGRGGSVIVRADANVTGLKSFLYQRHFVAESGAPGGSNHKKGKRGRDLVISVPCGTMIFEKTKRFLVRDLLQPGEEVILAEGGKGGCGNEGRKQAQPGERGGTLEIILSLKLPAEVFLAGLPNSGKSKLLNRLTHTHAKVETYPFSTTSPEVGAFETEDYEKIHLCELPALYRDSPKGRGVGFDFLKHLSRAKLILFLLDPVSSFASSLREGYEILCEVVSRYESSKRVEGREKSILEIPRAVVVNKMDLIEARQKVEREKFRPADPLFLISAETGEGVETLMRYVVQEVRKSSYA